MGQQMSNALWIGVQLLDSNLHNSGSSCRTQLRFSEEVHWKKRNIHGNFRYKKTSFENLWCFTQELLAPLLYKIKFCSLSAWVVRCCTTLVCWHWQFSFDWLHTLRANVRSYEEPFCVFSLQQNEYEKKLSCYMRPVCFGKSVEV